MTGMVEKMPDVVERLRNCHWDTPAHNTRMDAANEIERLRAALQDIVQWAEAYPTDIFHEPNKDECRRAHELLTAHGMTLDAFSASIGRHCTKGVSEIARRALEGK